MRHDARTLRLAGLVLAAGCGHGRPTMSQPHARKTLRIPRFPPAPSFQLHSQGVGKRGFGRQDPCAAPAVRERTPSVILAGYSSDHGSAPQELDPERAGFLRVPRGRENERRNCVIRAGYHSGNSRPVDWCSVDIPGRILRGLAPCNRCSPYMGRLRTGKRPRAESNLPYRLRPARRFQKGRRCSRCSSGTVR